MSKICSNCGAEWDNTANVCGNCGTALVKKKPKKKKLLIIALVLLAIAISSTAIIILVSLPTIPGDVIPDIDVLQRKYHKFSEPVQCGESAYRKLSSDGKLLVIYGTGCLKEGNVLAETEDSSTDFDGGIEYIIVEEGITKLLKNNFASYHGLRYVYLPSTLEEVEPGFTSFCHNLKDITFPNGNIRFVIKDSVMFSADEKILIKYCDNKSGDEYSIPSGVDTINKDAFSNAQNIKKVIMPDTVKRIEDGAFSQCDSLVEVEISDSVEIIGSGLFCWCRSLERVKLPGSITEIPTITFMGSGLKTCEIGNGVERIGWMAFMGCHSLEQIVIPDTVVEIEGSAFSGCTKLSSIKLPSQLELLGSFMMGSVFEDCTSIKEIVIPETCIINGPEAFSGWTAEQTIYFKAAQPGSEWDVDWYKNCDAEMIWNYKTN